MEHTGGRRRRVVVVGGASYLGSRLCAALLARGDSVVAMDSPAACAAVAPPLPRLRRRFELVSHEADDPGPVPQGVRVVVHLAGDHEPAAGPAEDRPTAATLGLLHALRVARENDARLVLASLPANAHRVETDEALAHGYRLAHDVEAVLVRVGDFVGPGMASGERGDVADLVRDAIAHQALVVAGGGLRSHRVCDVDDVVAGLVAVAGSRERGPVGLQHPDAFSEVDLAMAIAAAAGTACTVRFEGPGPGSQRRPLASQPSLDRLPCPEGWTPQVSVREALVRAMASWEPRPAATG